VRYTEKNVAADRQAAMEMVRASGQQGVPVITVNGQAVVGFNQPQLMKLLNQSRGSKTKPGPRLGASIADAASQARKRPDIPASGAYVGRVHPGSPAEQAGLHKGDVITALGGHPVSGAGDLHRLLREMPKGRDLSLTYVRRGQEEDTLVRL
jgi:S1-C subfamily serine protease